MRGRGLVMIVAGTLVVAACSESGGAAPRSEYVDGAVEVLSDIDEFTLPDGDVQCMAEAIVDGIGVDVFDEAGVSPDEFVEVEALSELDLGIDDEDLVDSLATGIRGCDIDFTDMFVEQVGGEFETLGLDGEEIECIAGGLAGDPNVQDLMSEFMARGAVTGDVDEAEDAGFAAGEDAAPEAFAACPSAVVSMFSNGLSQAGITVDDGGRQCLLDQIEALGADGVASLVAQGPDAEEVSQEMVLACSSELGL